MQNTENNDWHIINIQQMLAICTILLACYCDLSSPCEKVSLFLMLTVKLVSFSTFKIFKCLFFVERILKSFITNILQH